MRGGHQGTSEPRGLDRDQTHWPEGRGRGSEVQICSFEVEKWRRSHLIASLFSMKYEESSSAENKNRKVCGSFKDKKSMKSHLKSECWFARKTVILPSSFEYPFEAPEFSGHEFKVKTACLQGLSLLTLNYLSAGMEVWRNGWLDPFSVL